MSGIDFDLRDFDGTTRLFPLPNVVMFPHVILPLHIFEPRYKQMTEDALASDRLISIVRLRQSRPEQEGPPYESVACLGRIIEYQRLPEGRFNFLLAGLRRVALGEELSPSKLYRIARAELLEDVYPEHPPIGERSRFVSLLRSADGHGLKLSPELSRLLDGEIPLGVLTDLVTHSLPIPPALKQQLLAETRVMQRSEMISKIIAQLAGLADSPDRSFPPPFSAN